MEKHILIIGDVVGNVGMRALESGLTHLKEKYNACLVIANGENAADGFGLTEALAKQMFASGVDVITSGNHIWEKSDFLDYLNTENRILRPANYNNLKQHDVYGLKLSGNGFIKIEKDGVQFLIINLQGRQNMFSIDCPFKCFDSIYSEHADQKIITIVDFHAELSSEKEALAFYVDGRSTVVVGTHTHTQTADEKILKNGTAYITDIGMTGVLESVIGMDRDVCIKRSMNTVLYKMQCAEGAPSIQGVHVTVCSENCISLAIDRFSFNTDNIV
ncbi:MAG: TIGR00282 family metallophosphoesterase [Termitinemataceae bacterium]|nr:MAG: TIGR00282 family metallophosphoesterase [Termitinemataceae bacterium]